MWIALAAGNRCIDSNIAVDRGAGRVKDTYCDIVTAATCEIRAIPRGRNPTILESRDLGSGLIAGGDTIEQNVSADSVARCVETLALNTVNHYRRFRKNLAK